MQLAARGRLQSARVVLRAVLDSPAAEYGFHKNPYITM